MPGLRDHLPLAIVTIALSVAVFILFKEVKAAKDQALIGARFATTFQEQQQQQQPQQIMVVAPPSTADYAEPVEPAETRRAAAEDVARALETIPEEDKPVKISSKASTSRRA
jgi:hypothetical protein